ncbi:microcin C transport system substrate-binding protein [Roseibium hamelinense]|uniref:Microcin C transport system substrate-binding protein n=1 Tax=Roseibium hamelinense TaxID=150831 RepID=A0A562T1T9_9HYPH|nr:extracellular solute-binding protein [Roseibium hamelinense]MTI44647.1 ABC transporter substrate-binding protein [Roseibium hamelinense]TWI87273.1 microcin C transport system substrate-binding protein [Roseibium hamelinense]
MVSNSPSRREVLKLSGAAALFSAFPAGLPAMARQAGISHGLSVFGDLKYGPDFKHFDYVVPDAPKGGRFSFRAPSWGFNQNIQTYNTFNTFILKGDAPPRMELCFDSLMVRALDEPDAMYGLVAETVEVSEDGNTYTFNLRPEARFHDGSKLTAEDVAFSLMLLKEEGHPQISQTIRELAGADAIDTHRLEVRFSGNQTRQLPLFVAGLPIFSKRYYTAFSFDQSTLTPPLSSGPFKVGDHAVGRFVEYDRVKDYWAQDLPVVIGHYHFDVLRIEFFRDYQVSFEAFKKGNITFQEEFSSKIWATEYNFPAVEGGRVVQEIFPDNRPSGAQGWFFNTRRDKFADPRVREAIGYAFDFEWSNQSLFYGLYERTASFFENSDMKAEGLPSEAELALLEPFRGQVPDSVFGEPWVPPVSDGSGFDRSLLRKAAQMLKEAGYKRDGAALIGPDGQQLTIEFLNNSAAFERIVMPFITNLERLGIAATFRLVDPAQYQARLNEFDFDVAGRRYALSATLGDSIRQFWGSRAASTPGSYNLSGISDSAVDALIEKALAAETRDDMVIAARSLDRVLRSGKYWVPQWSKGTHTIAMWDMFGYPDKPPHYAFPVETTWWLDQEKAKKIGQAG